MTDIPEDCMETARALPDFHYRDDLKYKRVDDIARAIADERLREREECCKAVCDECERGSRVRPDKYGWWCHSWTTRNGQTVLAHETVCDASAIKERGQ